MEEVILNFLGKVINLEIVVEGGNDFLMIKFYFLN